jgi:beta-1,4-mannosyl-glycoprotein beta-1,4-N-acetylglucosaminyltransferase
MIYDCFTIRDELDMLELRLSILDNIVDKFVVVEANYTHKGELKEYNYLNNVNRFSKWEDKIIYIPIDFTEDVKNIDFTIIDIHTNIDKSRWFLENQQRNSILYGLENCNTDDIVIIGDVDEIPYNIPQYLDIPMVFVQNFYYYYLNNKSIGKKDNLWFGSIICKYKHLQEEYPQYYRNNRWSLYPIKNGGWHWSYFGGKEFIDKKLKSIVEGESVMKDFNISLEKIYENFNNLKDLYNREGMDFKLVDINIEYPTNLLEIINKYPQFIK